MSGCRVPWWDQSGGAFRNILLVCGFALLSVPWWDQPGGAFGDVNVDWSCFSFVYFDGAVEMEVFVKEFV